MYLWIVLTFLADRITKALVINALKPGQSIPVLPGMIHLTHVRNAGAAFGMLAGRIWILSVATIFLVAFLLWLHHFSIYRKFILSSSLGLIIGGALGNLADRILLGFVVDFVDLRIWPVFNVADVAIVAGAITAAIYFWRMADQHELDALQGKEMAENGG